MTSCAPWPRHVTTESGHDSEDRSVLDEAIRERLRHPDHRLPGTLGGPGHGEPRAQAHARPYHRGRDTPQAPERRHHRQYPSYALKGQDRDAHNAESQVLPRAGPDETREIVELVDQLLEHHISTPEIAGILDARGTPSRWDQRDRGEETSALPPSGSLISCIPTGSARAGSASAAEGMLNRKEMAVSA